MVVLMFFISIYNSTVAQIVFQGFEGSGSDNWNYSTNIPLYNLNTDTDVWDIYSGALGSLDGARSGSFYFAGRDLDNPHSESETGNSSPEHILTFDAINIGGISVDFSFWCNFKGYDSSDYIYYELVFDNGSDWSSPDIHIDIDPNPGPSNANSSGDTWEEFTVNIPTGNQYVRFRIVAYQNGSSDFIGLDDISLTSALLNTKDNELIELTYYPNPLEDKLFFSAKTEINFITIYNHVGQIISKENIKTTKGSLDTSELKSGIYFAEINSGKKLKTIKLIKE
ncbi:T9SS type A sorting domain-containing protein [Snuella lapsa]